MAIPLLHPHVLYVQLKAEEYPSYTVYLYKRFFPIAGVIAIAAMIAPMLAVFVSPSIPEARAATTYFSADAETGTIVPPWDDIFFNTTVSNSTAVAKNGSRSYKFTNAGGENDAKVIVYSNKSRHVEGYYSMWYYISAGYNDAKWRNNMQWKTDNGAPTTIGGKVKTIVGFEVINGIRQVALGVNSCGAVPFSCRFRQTTPIPVPFQKWFHLEIYYKAATTNGHIIVWQDGQEIFNATHANFDTLRTESKDNPNILSNNQYLYWGVGSYIDPTTTGEQTVYGDDAKITDYRVGTGTGGTTQPPSITLSANPDAILSGQTSTLQWSATNATSCSAPWTSSTAISGSQSVSPTQTATYTITCTGAGGSSTANATITVSASRPTYTAFKISAPPAIDGNLSEFQNANALTLSGLIGGNTGTYKLLWDSTNLYIGAEVNDTDLGASITARDGNLWSDDSLELFLDTLKNRGAAQGTDDYKFFVNLLNTQRDEQGGGAGFNATGVTSAVQVQGTNNNSADTDTKYAIEMKIPWSSLTVAAPAAGSSWGFDLAMNDNDPSTDDTTLAESDKVLFANIGGGSPNAPDGWGDIVFSGTTVSGGSGSLANSTTLMNHSNNFASTHPVQNMWDGCTTPQDSTGNNCTSGNENITSFWMEFDLQKPYDLSTARLFGDTGGTWVSNTMHVWK